jgi:mitogen-activated protein kinase kinase 3
MPGGALKLFKSMQAYEFNPLGMTSGGGNGGDAPLAAGVGAMQHSYKISEQDVRVIRTLGQGASALVQKVFIPNESRFAAVKKISILEREKRHQLMNDIKALCNAPNVPGLIRFFGAYHAADKGQIAVALEYMDGGSLADVLAKVGRIPEPILADIAAQIIPPLDFMHSHHMVHRDIKPANILMATSGDAKVSDFGISAFIDNTIAQCHTFLGTVTYMSPERIDGKPYSFPADIWAVGLTLLECATGKYPYDASGGTMALMLQLLEDECPLPPQDDDDDNENRQMNNNKNSLRNSKHQRQPCKLSPEFRDFIERCMYKDPMRRPSAADLMRHPFISRRQPADVRAFMSCMYDAEEKLADAVTIAATRFYNNLAWNWKDSDSIAAYYAPDAVFTFHGQKYKGRFTIASHFHQMMRQVGQAATSVAFDIIELSHQPLAGSKDQVVVQTTVEIVADESGNSSSSPSGGGGREEGSMGMGMGFGKRGSGNGRQSDDAGTTHGAKRVLGKFSDTFIMTMSSYDNALPGTGYTFNNQIFRWILALQPPKRRPGMSGGMSSGGGSNAQKCRVQ